jgi:glucokinase
MTKLHPLSLGVDLGGTSTRIGLYDDSMQLIASRSMPTRVSLGPQVCVAEIAAAIRSVLDGNGFGSPKQEILGIGIGSPGPMNLRTGVLGRLPNLPGWDDFPLRDTLAIATGLPVVLESDANAAALAEWKLGAGKMGDVDSMAMITLGTGVGSGLILGGRVWHGMFGMGGEVGHATVDPEGPVCGCGSRGCLEVYTSANGLLHLAETAAKSDGASPALKALAARSGGFSPIDVAELAKRDASAQHVFDRMGHYLGIGLANMINTLDLPLVVVGGGVASSWHLFAPSMFCALRDYSVVYRLATPTQIESREPDRTFICPAALGSAAGLMGAALLPRLAAQDAAAADTLLAQGVTG